ncbi:MAG: hypothetical protein NT018_08360 [Armatimonadetes bacterium]|nr:hypothetical protein [Armatimonadota bacterium]
MKCPKCGITNGKTNRFCRECGKKINWPKEQAEHHLAHAASHLDDLELGEELFSIMKLYDDGDLETAAECIGKIIERNPESASAHSILALIYERKAEIETAAGYLQEAQDFLQLAAAQYEQIIELNPRSAADREKLIGVCMKLAGGAAPQPSASHLPNRPARALAIKARIKAFLLSIPAPALASVGAFIVIIILGSTLILRSAKNNADIVSAKPARSASGIQTTVPNSTQPTGLADSGSEIQVYRYPTAPATPVPAPQPMETPKPAQSVEPIKLPNMNPELILVTEKSKPAQPRTVKIGESAPTPKPASEPPPEITSDQPSGSNLLAQAIILNNQGRYSEAINSAQQAAALFQADLNAGRNTTSAQLGLENANKCIQVWRSTENQ